MPIAVPVNARLHKKKDPTTTVEHASAMLAELPDWLPDRQLHFCADGAYACRRGRSRTTTPSGDSQTGSRLRGPPPPERRAPPLADPQISSSSKTSRTPC